MKLTMRAALVFAALMMPFTATAQLAVPMATTVVEVNLSFADCAARTEQALVAEGFAGLLRFGNGNIGFSAKASASLGCIHRPNANTVLFVVTAGELGNARERLLARMRGEVMRTSRGGRCGNLAGAWVSGGGPTSIEQDGDVLKFRNEGNATSVGLCAGDYEVVASEWDGGLHGMLNGERNEIRWTNGTRWSRSAPAPDLASVNPARFLGAWQRGGGRAEIRWEGSGLVCINEFGGRARCEVVDLRTIRAIDWEGGLLGVLTPDGTRIDWKNGSAWSR